jgi:hypothetical protein
MRETGNWEQSALERKLGEIGAAGGESSALVDVPADYWGFAEGWVICVLEWAGLLCPQEWRDRLDGLGAKDLFPKAEGNPVPSVGT